MVFTCNKLVDNKIYKDSKIKNIHYFRKLLKDKNIKVFFLKNKFDIYNDIARVMVEKLKANNERGLMTSFILPVGPRGQYQIFARIVNNEGISCKNLITINMDEYLDEDNNYINITNPLSFRNFMIANLFSLIDKKLRPKSENIYFPDPKNPDEIFKLILEIGGVDICFGGVGINGHIAFNEPMASENIALEDFKKLPTRILELSYETRIINSLKYGGNYIDFPKKCITIGIREILMSKSLRFYFEHTWQKYILFKTFSEEISPKIPVTILREHNNCSFFVNEEIIYED